MGLQDEINIDTDLQRIYHLPMNLKSYIRCAVVILCSVIICFFIWGLYTTLVGITKEGTVHNTTELPFVGAYLQDFNSVGPLKYASHQSLNRPYIVVTFTGQISRENLNRFVDSSKFYTEEIDPNQGWLISKDTFKLLGIGPDDLDHVDFVAGGALEKNEWILNLKIGIRQNDNRFFCRIFRYPKDYKD
jgi:hypothetical protein